VCVPGQQPGGQPAVLSGPAEALAAAEAGLGYLAGAEVADWPAEALAGCLRALGRAEAVHVAAQSRVLAAFNARGGFEADGQVTAKAWLKWQARITTGAAGEAAGWMRRLAVHSRVGAALGAGQVSVSFARLVCDWPELLAPELRDAADEILLAAARFSTATGHLWTTPPDRSGGRPSFPALTTA
jgi:hypothetical protein